MLNIKKIYRQSINGQSRVCADITINGKGTTLWFGVDEANSECLCYDRSDAFVMALLPAAMRGSHDIVCETPMSERLHYQLENYLIPTLCGAGDIYNPIKITAPTVAKPVQNKGAVATGFSGGVDCLYTIMKHQKESAFPITHLAVFNVGAFDGEFYKQSFHKACEDAAVFAKEQDYQLISLDSNIIEVLPEDFVAVCGFRNLASAMALQGLLSVYLHSSGYAFSEFAMELNRDCSFDLLLIHCGQTEGLSVFCPGGEAYRHEKLLALAKWEPAHRWLHPCFRRRLSKANCGLCKKCVRTFMVLYAYGVLDRFASVVDTDEFIKALPEHFAYLLANKDDPFNKNVLQIFKINNIPIPDEAYRLAKAPKAAKRVVSLTQAERGTYRALAQRLRNKEAPKKP